MMALPRLRMRMVAVVGRGVSRMMMMGGLGGLGGVMIMIMVITITITRIKTRTNVYPVRGESLK